MLFSKSKVKSVVAGILAASALCVAAVPVGAWSNSGSFSDVEVYNTGWHVFTLYRKAPLCATFTIDKWGKGKGNVKVDVYSGSYSVKKEFSGKDTKTWYSLDGYSTYNMDAICTASLWSSKGYRTISGNFDFS